ncbi:triose-phosphate isomerase [Candidatus Gracilibacteria bacterium]|nr:triose-phosphate isomerase [Candidatus Gracilibacteria bacterium]
MRTPLIAGNWKMNKTVAESVEWARACIAGLGDVSDREVLVCPPYTALATLAPLLEATPLALGAQDVFYAEKGAYTGAISPLMLKDLGCRYVIIGHSERRQHFGDNDAIVNKKIVAALGHGLKSILCVGESKPQRDGGEAETVVTAQVRAGLAGLDAAQMEKIVIAYEPIWAIGTGDTATAADAQAMHAAIRATLVGLFGDTVAAALRIQYGGSVKPDNVDELMAQLDIDGALVGGASLAVEDFLRIAHFV